jgi:hypothetical protein
MTHAQQYLDSLLGHIPTWELKSIEHRNMFDEIKERLATTENLKAELTNLYRVRGLADFALALLWITEKTENDPSRKDSTADEESLVFSKFRTGLGEESAGEPAAFAAAPVQDNPFGDLPTNMFDIGVPAPSESGSPFDQEKSFADVLEKFLVAIQSASDDRMTLEEELERQCGAVRSGAAALEFQEFSLLLLEFLHYVTANQFLDDIRVMNIVSNIQDPFMQWMGGAGESKPGLLSPAIEILRDFKSMFE